LILDADERVPDELVHEIIEVLSAVDDKVGAFRVKRRFHLWGRWLRHSSLYPTWVVRLIRKKRVRYIDRGHAETQTVDGEIQNLCNDLIDQNLKGIDDWFARQNYYSRHDADYELTEQLKGGGFARIVRFRPAGTQGSPQSGLPRWGELGKKSPATRLPPVLVPTVTDNASRGVFVENSQHLVWPSIAQLAVHEID
jgi:hypothetical protein